MRKRMLLCVSVLLLVGMATNALAVRQLWYTSRGNVDVWDTSGTRLDTLAVPLIAGADIALAQGVVQNPADGEVLVAVRYYESDWTSVGNRLLRYEQSSAGDGDYDFLGEAGTLSGQPYGLSAGDDGMIYMIGDYANVYTIDPVTYTDTFRLADVSGTHDITVSDGVAYLGRYNYPKSVRSFNTTTWARYDDLYDENPVSLTYEQGGACGVQVVDGKLYVADYASKIWEWDVTGGPGTFDTLTPTLIYDGSQNGPDGKTLEKNGQLRWNDEDEWFSSDWAGETPAPYMRAFYYDDGGSLWRHYNPPSNMAYDIDSNGYGAYHAWVDPDSTGVQPPTPKNRGDVTEDDFVGADDLVRILTHWGESGSVPWENGDIAPYGDGTNPGDDFVGADDYVEVLTYWGTDYSSPEPTPEPATMLVLALGAVAGMIRRK